MEQVEHGQATLRDEFASRYNFPGPDTVALKKGITLSEVEKGVDFETKEGVVKDRDANEANYFDGADVLNHLNYDCLDQGEDSSETPFEIMAHGMENVAEDGGVKKKIIRSGVGAVVAEGATCRVHYNAYLEYSEEPFDSSRLRDEQHMFRLGQGECLPGWQAGVSTMRKGEISRFLMRPEYCYGEMGCPPRIPPKSTMLFEIELIQFIDHKAADDFAEFSKEERNAAPFEQILAVINAEREAGNDFFARNMIAKAMTKYGKAINLLENVNLRSEQEEHIWKQALLKLYLNISLCCIKQTKSPRAIMYCRKILDMESNNIKALYRLGQAYHQLGEFKQARAFLTSALKIAPSNRDIIGELRKLDSHVEEYRNVERETYRRMFGNQEPVIPVMKGQCKPLYGKEMYEDVLARLESFVASPIANVPFPAHSMDEAERQCIEHVCAELRLHYQCDGEGLDQVLMVSKATH